MSEEPTVKPVSNAELLDRAISADESELNPWIQVELPSRGLYYDDVPDGIVHVKAMNFFTDKILATSHIAHSGESIDRIFKHCVKFPSDDFDSNNLLLGDRAYLLYVIRGITHGPIYEFMATCSNPDCQATFSQEYNLNDLVVEDNITYGSIAKREPVKVVLPHFSKLYDTEFYVKVRFMRGYDLKNLMKKMKMKKRTRGKVSHKEMLDDTMEQNMSRLVVEAMGSDDKLKIKKLLNKMHARDSAEIREAIRQAPGIDAEILVICPECDHEMRMELPITESFFRPTVSGSSGEGVLAFTGAGVST